MLYALMNWLFYWTGALIWGVTTFLLVALLGLLSRDLFDAWRYALNIRRAQRQGGHKPSPFLKVLAFCLANTSGAVDVYSPENLYVTTVTGPNYTPSSSSNDD